VKVLLRHPRSAHTNKAHHNDGYHPIHRAAWGLEEGHTRTVSEFITHDPFSVLIRSKTGYIPSELAAAVVNSEGRKKAKHAEQTTKIIHESLHGIKAQRNPTGFIRGGKAPKIDVSQYFKSKEEL